MKNVPGIQVRVARVLAAAGAFLALGLGLCIAAGRAGEGVADRAVARYQEQIEPLLVEYCYGCHAVGIKKGQVSFDQDGSDEALVKRRELWWSVLKNVRAGIMPPAGEPRPTDKEVAALADWIKRDVLAVDASDPDPGRVTIRRLNRVEYHNSIRDLTGVDFKAEEEFPPDDTGYGFDNIGDVLSVSPLLLEKYFQAAESIVKSAVPTASRLTPERRYRGVEFRGTEKGQTGDKLPFSRPATVSRTYLADAAGEYRIQLELAVKGPYKLDPGRSTVTFQVDGRERLRETYSGLASKTFHHKIDQHLAAGEHKLAIELKPGEPRAADAVELRVVSVVVQGPLDAAHRVKPTGYERFFPRDEAPATDPDRRIYAREVLDRFARRAFRRPVDARTLDRLVAIAESTYRLPGRTFEEGIGQAFVAVLASPRFLFRVEGVEPGPAGRAHAPIDEYALASRLSYFLWSTMPDDELLTLAGLHRLRAELPAQVKRMLAHPLAKSLTQNFVGQWLEVRDLDGIYFNERAILRREGVRLKGADTERNVLTRDVRRAMRSETEMAFEYVLREDRSVLEWVDCDYTFLNARLAKVYGIPGVEGSEMRRVTLPKDSPRGGVLTHGSILAVTSNPARTSPVKRGQFILDNILGTPAPPPPPDIPALEDARKDFKDRTPTTRELMAMHRSKPLCSSCHSRMDPLGLALDNFNPLGMYRLQEEKQPIDASGKLITGESFHDVRELKKILRERHRADFYRCLTEKLLTYALGRGLEPTDVETVDRIVDRLDRDGGRFSALLTGVIESPPFQRRRTTAIPSTTKTKVSTR
jgi:mono/diheme cytochrome c family protein